MENLYSIQQGAINVKRWGAELDFSKIKKDNKNLLLDKTFTVTCSANCSQIFEFSFVSGNSNNSQINGNSLHVSIGIDNESLSSGDDILNAIIEQANNNQGALGYSNPDICQIGHANAMTKQGEKIIFYSLSQNENSIPTYPPGMGLVLADELEIDIQNTSKIQCGPNALQQMDIVLPGISNGKLGISGVSVLTSDRAKKSLQKLDGAIDYLNKNRSRMGSYQNRLGYTYNFLSTSNENLTNSHSKIIDTDMAKEVMKMTRLNVLGSAAQTMLAQANSSSQYIFKLIQ